MIVFLIKHKRRPASGGFGIRVYGAPVGTRRQNRKVARPSAKRHGVQVGLTPDRGPMTSVLTLMGRMRGRRFHSPLLRPGGFLPAGNGERMANKLGIAGQQAHTLLLRLDKQQFVERSLCPSGCVSSVAAWRGQRQQLPIYRCCERHYGRRVESRALSHAGDVETVPLQPEFPDHHSRQHKRRAGSAIRLRSPSVNASGSVRPKSRCACRAAVSTFEAQVPATEGRIVEIGR